MFCILLKQNKIKQLMHKMESELAKNATFSDQLSVISDRNEDYCHMLASFVEYIDHETTVIESG